MLFALSRHLHPHVRVQCSSRLCFSFEDLMLAALPPHIGRPNAHRTSTLHVRIRCPSHYHVPSFPHLRTRCSSHSHVEAPWRPFYHIEAPCTKPSNTLRLHKSSHSEARKVLALRGTQSPRKFGTLRDRPPSATMERWQDPWIGE